MDALPPCCVCCKKPHRIQQLEAAMDKLNKETDLVELVKQIRFLKKVVF